MKNNRTFLEKLLDGSEVEWKPLSLVTEMQRGKTITAKSANEGKIPVISGGQKPAYYHSESNRDGKTITVAGSGAYAGYIMYWEEPIFVSDAFSIKTDESLLQIKYVYHFLLQNQQKIYAMKKGSGVPHVYPKDIGTLTIPIPPLSVQTEIVKILDALTALTSELTSELILRQKQYEYYREKLLSEEELEKVGFEWKTLDEIFHLKNGYTPSKGIKEYWENGSIPWFRMEDIRENGRILNTALQKVSESAVKGGKLFPANSIIIATSATIGEHALITIPFLANQRFTVLSLKPEYIDKFNIYFLYHYCFTLDDWCQKNTTMSSFASVDMNGFRRFPIPIPPLSVQTEIVKILDAFETLTNSITEGLPLAIEQSQKRYEYYRELLLNFS